MKTTEEIIWEYIFELFNVKSHDELVEKLKIEYRIVI